MAYWFAPLTPTPEVRVQISDGRAVSFIIFLPHCLLFLVLLLQFLHFFGVCKNCALISKSCTIITVSENKCTKIPVCEGFCNIKKVMFSFEFLLWEQVAGDRLNTIECLALVLCPLQDGRWAVI